MNDSFMIAAGVCSIVAVGFFVVSIVGVEATRKELDPYLRNVQNNILYAISIWALFFVMLLLIPTFLGFYQALSEGGSILWVALAVSLTGVTIALASIPIYQGIMHQLASDYAEADSSIRPALEVVARTLLVTAERTGFLGIGVFSLGIGVVLFSIGIVNTSVIAHWMGWIGVVAGGLLAIVFLLYIFGLKVPKMIRAPGLMIILLWMVVMGVFLVQLGMAA